MKYIKHEDGTVIDGFRAAEICHYARSLWVQMALDEKLSTDASMSVAANLPSTSVLPSLTMANNGQKHLKRTHMQPTKTTTARYVKYE